ncbi:MAG: hypothetical protein AMJ65_03845 [Phycisphaerae bacterium SG8_4]|nr:MAG: hypothetical protein AMJ65_03845 [Phycisphaerae bacterium SG8_4]
MTRRKFIRRLIATAMAIFAGALWLACKAPPRFVRAVRIKQYPGVLKPLEDISGPSKWSG